MNSLVRNLGLALLLAVPGFCGAETLGEAWTIALSAHQGLAAAEARRDAAKFEVDYARSERLPKLNLATKFTQLDSAPSFEFGGGLASDKLFSSDNFATAGTQVTLPLYTGGSIAAGIDAAEHSAAASASQFAAFRQDIKLGTGEHYVQVLRAESALSIARSNVETLRAHSVDARKRYEFGDVPKNDYLAASVSLANAEQRRLQAENALDYARAAYNRFLGRTLDQTVSLDPHLDIDQLLPDGQDLDELIRMAGQNRDELGTLESQAAALHGQASAAKGQSRPQIALTGGYMFLENEFLDTDAFWMVGMAFQWHLFDGGRSRNRAAALDHRALAVRRGHADLATTISLQVRRNWNDRRAAEHRAVVAEAAVEQAAENLRVVRNRYVAGASTNVVVLDAESLRQQALGNHDSARYELALAKIRLARSVGVL